MHKNIYPHKTQGPLPRKDVMKEMEDVSTSSVNNFKQINKTMENIYVYSTTGRRK